MRFPPEGMIPSNLPKRNIDFSLDVKDKNNNNFKEIQAMLKANESYTILPFNLCLQYTGRIISLDTETTGLNKNNGDRLTEIGCVELINNKITGKFFQSYINPCRDVGSGAMRVTGLTQEFLKDKPVFSEMVNDFLNFIQDSPLIIHNANFDIPFINYELELLNRPPLTNRVVDTLTISREFFPGKPCNLDAVCRRLNIDNSIRSLHGALLDAQILSKVYIGLLSVQKSQNTFDVFMEDQIEISESNNKNKIKRKKLSKDLVTDEDYKLHNNFFNR